ncbi:hypothetical protein Goari_023999, partial [Gossypium aridum]|nr:hypothetical protein [Gossypium aridum]
MSVSCNGGDEPRSFEDRITKKARFKEGNCEEGVDMVVDLEPKPTLTWKDKLLGEGLSGSSIRESIVKVGMDEEFVLLEGDMVKSIVNGITTINFSYRIMKILFKEMEKTVVLKLLGRSISYVALHNRISSLWRPSKLFSLMDIENVYFLVKFQSTDDYDRVPSQRPWIIYNQYLTVQTWTKDFNPMQPYPSVVMAWIRLSGLPRYMYKRVILEVFGNMIRKVTKLNFQTDKKIRRRFARMAIYINLKRPLVSQPLVKGEIQKVENVSIDGGDDTNPPKDSADSNQDSIELPIGPITRARAKCFKESISTLVDQVWEETTKGLPSVGPFLKEHLQF